MSQTRVAWTDGTGITKHLASDNRDLVPSADRPPPQHDDREQIGAGASTRQLLCAEGSHMTTPESHTGSTIGRSKRSAAGIGPRRFGSLTAQGSANEECSASISRS